MNNLPNHLKEAAEILHQYAQPYDSLIDNGNLFFAATEFQSAYLDVLKDMESMAKALEYYANDLPWKEAEVYMNFCSDFCPKDCKEHTIINKVMQKPARHCSKQAFEALKIWRKKYGESNDKAK